MLHDRSAEGADQLQQIEKRVPTDYRWVRRSIHELEAEFAAVGISPDDVGSISIILAEVLNNIVEHATEDAKEGHIDLVVRARGKSLVFEIRDSGRPMPAGRAPIGNNPMNDAEQLESLPEGGFGWFLIRELVQDLVYDRQNDENILFFRYRMSE